MENIENSAKTGVESISVSDLAASSFAAELQDLAKTETVKAQSFPQAKEAEKNSFRLAADLSIQDRPPKIEPIPPWKPDPICGPFDPFCKPKDPPMPWDPPQPKPHPKKPRK